MLLLGCVLGAAFVACSGREQAIQLRFSFDNPGSVHHLQFYVHDVVLLGRNGEEYPVRLATQSPWQTERVALIDVSPQSSTPTRKFVEGSAQAVGGYAGVRFAVGVPFDLNHANPMTAIAPLNRGEMFWSWQSGYKFLRVDLSADEHAAAFHLGSTGCSSASAIRPPKRPCAQPNVIQVELADFDPQQQTVDVNVEDIVAALSVGNARACTGDYSQDACAAAFATTGLDPSSGRCSARGEAPACSQRLFTASRMSSRSPE